MLYIEFSNCSFRGMQEKTKINAVTIAVNPTAILVDNFALKW